MLSLTYFCLRCSTFGIKYSETSARFVYRYDPHKWNAAEGGRHPVGGLFRYILLITQALPYNYFSLRKFSGAAEVFIGEDQESGLTKEQKQFLLDEHNSLRSAIAVGHGYCGKTISNMLPLVWSDSLAARAQVHACDCTGPSHDAESNRLVRKLLWLVVH